MEKNIKNIFLKKIKPPFINGKIDFNLLKGGRNNKVFLVKLGNSKYIMKYYSKKKINSYSREKFFLKHFANQNIENVPKYLFSIRKNIFVISFIEGKKINKISNFKIRQACEFLNKINKIHKKKLIKLPKASDSCFSFYDHIRITSKKVNRLKNIVEKEHKNKRIYFFIKNKIIPRFNYEKKLLYQNYSNIFFKDININDIVFSPSDFGFHNMIEKKKCFFIDFEYSGIDDLAKLICDFICQPDLQLNQKNIDYFLKNLKIGQRNLKKIILKSKILLNIHRIKWCCVILNDFLPQYKNRQFQAGFYNKSLLNKQLNKSILYFNKYL